MLVWEIYHRGTEFTEFLMIFSVFSVPLWFKFSLSYPATLNRETIQKFGQKKISKVVEEAFMC